MKKIVALLVVLAMANFAFAQFSLTIPAQVIDNAADQTVYIQVSASPDAGVDGSNLNVSITGDVGGSAVFSGADWATGTIWSGNVNNASSNPQGKVMSGQVTALSEVTLDAAGGALVGIEVDASSFVAGGSFLLNSFSTQSVPFPPFSITNETQLLDSDPDAGTVTEFNLGQIGGTITVTPEPASALLLGLAGLFLRRRHA